MRKVTNVYNTFRNQMFGGIRCDFFFDCVPYDKCQVNITDIMSIYIYMYIILPIYLYTNIKLHISNYDYKSGG